MAIFIPNVPPPLQRELFEAALQALTGGDLFNRAMELDFVDGEIEIVVFDLSQADRGCEMMP